MFQYSTLLYMFILLHVQLWEYWITNIQIFIDYYSLDIASYYLVSLYYSVVDILHSAFLYRIFTVYM